MRRLIWVTCHVQYLFWSSVCLFICWPIKVSFLLNSACRNCVGVICRTSLIALSCCLTSIAALFQLGGSLYASVASLKALSFGYMSDSLFTRRFVSPGKLTSSRSRVSYACVLRVGFCIVVRGLGFDAISYWYFAHLYSPCKCLVRLVRLTPPVCCGRFCLYRRIVCSAYMMNNAPPPYRDPPMGSFVARFAFPYVSVAFWSQFVSFVPHFN